MENKKEIEIHYEEENLDNISSKSATDENSSLPNTSSNRLNYGENFSHSKNNNNPALGQNNRQGKNAEPSLPKKNDNNSPNNIANNINNTNNDSSNNPMSNASKKSDVNDENSKNKSEGFDPRKKTNDLNPSGRLNNKKSKQGLGNFNQGGSTGKKIIKNPLPKNLIKKILTNSVYRKFAIVGGGGIFLLMLALGLFIIISTVIVSTSTLSCDSPLYAVDSSDATGFLCNMQSPFKEDDYTVTSLYGWRISPFDDTKTSFHSGIDIVGKKGASQKVNAVADGEVILASYDGGYGNSVVIKHNGDYTTRYAHLSNIDSNIEVGKSVESGTVVGIQGTTGDSTGVHLHFEIRDKDSKTISPNPFFGYSDQGYEECVNASKTVGITSSCVKDDTPTARYIGQEGFNQICGRSNAFNANASSSNSCCGIAVKNSNEATLVDFMGIFEGGTGSSYQCTTSDGLSGYKVYNNGGGDKNTVGPGVTTDYLSGISVGECISKKEVEEGMTRAIGNKRDFINNKFRGANLTSYQEDAMTSMAYNGCGSFFNDIAKAARVYDLAGVWNAMKDCTNDGLLGLKRRRKAEFALYVTGDYSVASSYKLKDWSNDEYDDYDSDGVIAKKASGTSSTTCSFNSSSNKDVISIANRELKLWERSSSDAEYCSAISKYTNSCGGGNKVDEYCAGFVTYVLKQAGLFDSVGLPSNTCNVGSFKNPTIGKIYPAGGAYVPKPGDLFITGDYAHIGFVEKVVGTTVHTIEGNTTPLNKYCGKGTIARKTRTSEITYYVTY